MTETPPLQTAREPLQVHDLIRELGKLVPRVSQDGKKRTGDRAALAALRRGLGKEPGEAPEMFAVLYSRIPEEQLPLSPRDEPIIFLIASLFALYPDAPPWPEAARERQQRSLGASLRHLSDQAGSDGPERRLVALLNSDVADLPHHLRGIIALLKSAKHPIPVDWVRLTWDLRQWTDAERTVQKAWAIAFWGGKQTQAETDTESTDDQESA